MKAKYVKPEMVIESVSIEGAVMLTMSTTEATNMMETKGRLDLDDEGVSSNGWEDGLW